MQVVICPLMRVEGYKVRTPHNAEDTLHPLCIPECAWAVWEAGHFHCAVAQIATSGALQAAELPRRVK